MTLHFVDSQLIENTSRAGCQYYSKEVDWQRREACRRAVRTAIQKLTTLEQDVIRRRYLEFQSFTEIADEIGLPKRSIEAVHNRAVKVLHQLLSRFVQSHFQICAPKNRCLICRSPNRLGADDYLSKGGKHQPYYLVMRTLHDRYGIRLASFKTIIGHMKFHQTGGEHEPSTTK